jgi:predicted small lipoprotein YifL
MVTMRRFRILAMTGFCLGLLLTGCGRKAALETPSASTQPVTATTAAGPVQGSDIPATGTSEPAAPKTNSGFFLDPLIGQ